jgi:multimeric flavodoxin WrbA
MNIGIMVHSQTGHTLSVAQKIHETLNAQGHTVHLEKVEAAKDSVMDASSVVLTQTPKIDGFDWLIFAAPVRGGKLSPAMQAYLLQLPSLEGHRVSGFVTQFFPSPSLGGHQAIAQMHELCKAKSGDLVQTGIVNWLFPSKRKKLTQETVERLTRLE